MEKQEFKWRSFISFGMFFSFLIMGISGLILYIAPPGRVFRWINWHLLWIDLYQWQALHTLFSYLFLGFAISHVFSMNWKILFSYFTRRTKQGLRRKRELISSSIVILVFVFGTLFNIPPFQSIMNIGGWASKTWGEKIDYPPVAHTEEMQLAEIASILLKIEVSEFRTRIDEAGYALNSMQQTLDEVCNMNEIAPYEFFRNTTKELNVLVIPAAK